ncbi:cytochrome c-type biogenesis CcmF C-terminal domain-containing protein, partial [Achromobacter xylosoxidans]
GDKHVATLRPETRRYVVQAMPMTQSAIDVGPLRDLYTALGEGLPDGSWIVNLFHKPFISWIWAGCALMM